MFSPHNSERQRERQRGLVKQTFELDEAAAAERQDEQVANGAAGSACILKAFSLKVLFLHTVLIFPKDTILPGVKAFISYHL